MESNNKEEFYQVGVTIVDENGKPEIIQVWFSSMVHPYMLLQTVKAGAAQAWMRGFGLGGLVGTILMIIVWVAVANSAQETFCKLRAKMPQAAAPQILELMAVATVESNINPKAVGAVGEIGAWQMRPEYHPDVTRAKTLETQAVLAAALLAKLHERCGPVKKFGCYNMGIRGRLKLSNVKTTVYERKVKNVLKKLTAEVDNSGCISPDYSPRDFPRYAQETLR